MDNATYNDLTAALILRNVPCASEIVRCAAVNKGPIPLRQLRPRAKAAAGLTICRRHCSGAGPCSRTAMRPGRKATAAIFAGLFLSMALCAIAQAQTQVTQVPTPTPAMLGQALAFDRASGNCLTCHDIRGGDAPGNVGPPLADMKKRFPDRKELAAIIFDETKRNPQTVMPPFGRNLILSNDEIEAIVDFLYTR
jgi:L-cysteine S-thiosulfotransferase